MKVTSIELHPSGSDDVCVLSFRDPRRRNPYNVKAMVGLGADEIVHRFYGVSGSSKFYNLSVEKKDVIARIALNPAFANGETFSTLRDRIYKMISSSRRGVIDLHFMNLEQVVAKLSGFVTKMETPYFEKEQEVQITISCIDPMLRSPDPVSVSLVGQTPELTVVDDDISTAPHGLSFELEIGYDLAEIVITDPDDDSWQFRLAPVGGFLTGDVLHCSSEYNNKLLYVERSGNDIPIVDTIVQGSVWPIIFPGSNKFSIANAANLTWNSISYYPTYWGV